MKKMLFSATALIVLSSVAFAADLPSKNTAPVMAAAPLAYSWTGAYVGASLGLDFGTAQFNDGRYGGSNNVWNAAGDRFTARRTGLTANVQAGYNQQFGSMVYGIEGDLGYLGGRGSRASSISSDTIGYIRDGFYGTLRARAGFAVARVLIFATGGVIFADHGARVSDVLGNTLTTNRTGLQAGWTVGGGIEYAITNNWSIKGDMLYYDLGKKIVLGQRNGVAGAAAQYGFKVRNSGELVRIGLNYKF